MINLVEKYVSGTTLNMVGLEHYYTHIHLYVSKAERYVSIMIYSKNAHNGRPSIGCFVFITHALPAQLQIFMGYNHALYKTGKYGWCIFTYKHIRS